MRKECIVLHETYGVIRHPRPAPGFIVIRCEKMTEMFEYAQFVYTDTDLSLRTIKCSSVVFGVTLRLIVINISSTSPVKNKRRRLLPAVVSQLVTVQRRRVDNT